MARAIDGDALFCKFWSLADPYVEQEKVYPCKIWNQAATMAREAPAITPPNKWISVEERLPMEGTVLATDGNVVITAPSSSVTADGPAITHWMPLPEPPEALHE